MMIIMTIYLPLPLPGSSYCHLTPSGGSAPTPDSRPNPVCGLGAFQESQASFSDLMTQLGTWVPASPLLRALDS